LRKYALFNVNDRERGGREKERVRDGKRKEVKIDKIPVT